ncbi:cytochrome P450 [Obba rivulosa]|uniref:Cytochrome P450 n=1 Tax=Obba rivulosa TaxID=1052685 RepID=A0A8E2APL0_9APHY|nr:cytochrome P450 [Obba rivulosa]
MSSLYSLLAASVLVGTALALLLRRRRHLPYPPGPKGWPIIGNMLDVPTSYPELAYREMSRTYGPVVYMRVLGQSMVILNSAKAACDLLEARSATYSDRMSSVMASMMGLDPWNTVLMRYGPTWRKHRKVIHQYFNVDAIRAYQPLQLRKARELLRRVHEDPSDFLRISHFAVGSNIMELCYGRAVDDIDDPYLAIARKSAAAAEGLVSGAFIVEFLPFLRHIPTWFPGAGFKRQAARGKEDFDALLYVPFNDVKATRDKGHAAPSILNEMLDKCSDVKGASGIDEDVARALSAVMYGAGADTTYATTQTFFLAMVLYPDVQRKAQAQLDLVVGSGRLPEYSDRESLPYINAIVRECTRWMPVLPLGVPHACIADDEYNGYFIPKGSVVILNQWAILHNPDDYPEPEVFDPDRFIKNGELNPDKRDADTAAFGFGRRMCAGRHFSDATLFIMMASILHVFDIRPIHDEHGTPILPEARATSGFFSYPFPFRCDIKPRSASSEELISDLH